MSTLLGPAKGPRLVRDPPWWFQLHLDPPMMVAVLLNTPTQLHSHLAPWTSPLTISPDLHSVVLPHKYFWVLPYSPGACLLP